MKLQCHDRDKACYVNRVLATALSLLWGLIHGMRHALEPDHLAAVSALVADRRSLRSTTSYALAWGLGHAMVLLVVGGALLLLRGRVPSRLGASFELAVAVVLVLVGMRALRHAVAPVSSGKASQPPEGTSTGEAVSPEHAPDHAAETFGLARRPLLVGCVHGLAGSGAVAALVLSQMKAPLAGLAYMALYGGGAALGMATLAGAAGMPLAWIVRTRGGRPILLGTTGVLSLGLGIVWAFGGLDSVWVR